jgi:N6-L-threonylcarbamoyladenine synthase
MTDGLILAIETSCDETAVALADLDGRILGSYVSSQVALHAPYGGVVPELASRNHNVDLRPLVAHALDDQGVARDQLALIAATSGPGLASSLLIGDTTAKAIAVGLSLPFYSINHMEGHLLSPFIGGEGEIPEHLGLIVSGGHTLLVDVAGTADYEVIGSTKDDAAGEAFDKVGKILGLPYPGGPEISRLASGGRRDAFDFPRSMIHSGDFEFSFSGLKTAVLYTRKKMGAEIEESVLRDLCASFEEAVVDVLVAKTLAASRGRGKKILALSGGVSCNDRLRERLSEEATAVGCQCQVSDRKFSTDNAAMIAFAAAKRHQAGIAPDSLHADIDPNWKLG